MLGPRPSSLESLLSLASSSELDSLSSPGDKDCTAQDADRDASGLDGGSLVVRMISLSLG